MFIYITGGILKAKKTNTKAYLIGSGLLLSAGFLMLFGVSILTNVHLTYLRALSQWTVMLTNKDGTSGATGFIAKGKSGKSYIITNNHVCRLAEDGKLNAIYRGDIYVVRYVTSYAWNDLCALEAPSTILFPVHVAGWVTNGEKVSAIGHPLLEPLSVTQGELSGLVKIEIPQEMNPLPDNCKGPTYTLVQVPDDSLLAAFGINSICIRSLLAEASTVPILPGNSGSPVVNIYGSVVGVAFAASNSGTRSYIVPLEHLKDFLSYL